jgi:hypothetical protein
MDAVYIDKCQCEIQEQKEVPVWCTGIYLPISSTAYIYTFMHTLKMLHCSLHELVCGLIFSELYFSVSPPRKGG